MVLGLGRKILGRRIALPWGSIDSEEGIQPTTWEAEKDGDWFLEAPPGNWQMEKAVASTPEAPSDDAETDHLIAPQETLPGDVDEEEAYPPRIAAETGAWTLAMLCVGLSVIAASLIIPQADSNRRLAYQHQQLQLDLTQVQKQIAVNKEFLSKMESDPQLTERLAQREMRAVEQGEAVVDVHGDADSAATASNGAERMSPFTLVQVPLPATLPRYEPVGGTFAQLCRDPQSHVYLLGGGMIMVAAGLVIGGPGKAKLPFESDVISPQI